MGKGSIQDSGQGCLNRAGAAVRVKVRVRVRVKVRVRALARAEVGNVLELYILGLGSRLHTPLCRRHPTRDRSGYPPRVSTWSQS